MDPRSIYAYHYVLRWNPIRRYAQYWDGYHWDTDFINDWKCNRTAQRLKYKDTWTEPELGED